MVKTKDFGFIEKKEFRDFVGNGYFEGWYILVSRINTHKTATYGPFASFEEAVAYASILNVELKNV